MRSSRWTKLGQRGAILAASVACSTIGCWQIDELRPFEPDGGVPQSGDAAFEPDVNNAEASTTVADRYRSAVLADHPIGYYRFDEATGNAKDSADAAASNAHEAIYESKESANSLAHTLDPESALSGNAAVALHGDHLDLQTQDYAFDSSPFTLEAWVKQTDQQTSGFVEVINRLYTAQFLDGSTQNYGYHLFLMKTANDSGVSGVIEFVRQTDKGSYAQVSGGMLPFGAWVHLAAVYDDQQRLHLYVNAVEVNFTGATSTGSLGIPSEVDLQFSSGGASVTLQGGGYKYGHNDFPGSFDEFALYDYALTADQVANHYHASGR